MATCEVSGYGCEAPANLAAGDQPARLPTCYRCGLPVCRECSTVSPDPMRRGRRTRRCDSCRDAEEAPAEPGHPDWQHVERGSP